MPTALNSEMSMLVLTNPRALLDRLLLAVYLVACLANALPLDGSDFVLAETDQRKAVA